MVGLLIIQQRARVQSSQPYGPGPDGAVPHDRASPAGRASTSTVAEKSHGTFCAMGTSATRARGTLVEESSAWVNQR